MLVEHRTPEQAPPPAGGTEFDRERSPRFTKLFDSGIDRIIGLAENPVAMKIWAFFVKNCDYHNAIVCGYEVLTEEIGVSERTIRRAVAFLVDNQAVSIAKAGTTNVYILNHTDIWKTYEENRKYCMFGARTIISKKHNKNLKARLTYMATGEKQGSLFEDD